MGCKSLAHLSLFFTNVSLLVLNFVLCFSQVQNLWPSKHYLYQTCMEKCESTNWRDCPICSLNCISRVSELSADKCPYCWPMGPSRYLAHLFFHQIYHTLRAAEEVEKRGSQGPNSGGPEPSVPLGSRVLVQQGGYFNNDSGAGRLGCFFLWLCLSPLQKAAPSWAALSWASWSQMKATSW